jgi:hypothetical protein
LIDDLADFHPESIGSIMSLGSDWTRLVLMAPFHSASTFDPLDRESRTRTSKLRRAVLKAFGNLAGLQSRNGSSIFAASPMAFAMAIDLVSFGVYLTLVTILMSVYTVDDLVC